MYLHCVAAFNGSKEQGRHSGNHTSLAALRVHTPYVIASIPPNMIAVLTFQLDGLVHQPPSKVPIKFESRTNDVEHHTPAGLQTCFGYGYLAPPPFYKGSLSTTIPDLVKPLTIYSVGSECKRYVTYIITRQTRSTRFLYATDIEDLICCNHSQDMYTNADMVSQKQPASLEPSILSATMSRTDWKKSVTRSTSIAQLGIGE
jgi:hypothetical protein